MKINVENTATHEYAEADPEYFNRGGAKNLRHIKTTKCVLPYDYTVKASSRGAYGHDPFSSVFEEH